MASEMGKKICHTAVNIERDPGGMTGEIFGGKTDPGTLSREPHRRRPCTPRGIDNEAVGKEQVILSKKNRPFRSASCLECEPLHTVASRRHISTIQSRV